MHYGNHGKIFIELKKIATQSYEEKTLSFILGLFAIVISTLLLIYFDNSSKETNGFEMITISFDTGYYPISDLNQQSKIPILVYSLTSTLPLSASVVSKKVPLLKLNIEATIFEGNISITLFSL